MNRSALTSGKTLLALGLGCALASLIRRPRFNFGGRVIVITGGSRGLGLLVARKLVRERASVVLLARSADQLERAAAELNELGSGRAIALRCDVRKREQVDHAFQRILERFGRIDVLINNAGAVQVGPLEHMACEDFEQAMAVHFFGPLFTTLAALPVMRQAGHGRIVNISSIGGRIAAPHLVPYSASKFALVGLSDGFRAELRRDGIFVTTVLPGLMRTGSPPNAHFKGRFQHEYAWFALSDALPGLSVSANRAAREIIEACRRGSPRLTIGLPAKAAIFMHDLFPGLAARTVAWANRLLPSPDSSGSKELHLGWDSQSRLAPSWFTVLSDRATIENNENRI